MRALIGPQGILMLFGGKPFTSNPIGRTEDEFLADLRQRRPERCKVSFENDLLEIDLLNQLSVNPCRTTFKGRFRHDESGLKVDGKFEYGLLYRLYVSA